MGIEAYTGPEHAAAEEKVVETPPMNDVDDEIEPEITEEPVAEEKPEEQEMTEEMNDDMKKYLTAIPEPQGIMDTISEFMSGIDYRILIVVAVIAVVLARRS